MNSRYLCMLRRFLNHLLPIISCNGINGGGFDNYRRYPPPPPRVLQRTTSKSHIGAPPPPWPCVPFPLRVVVSTSQPGVFVITAYWALIRPSGENAMGRSCILDPPPPPRQGDARGSADARSSTDACLSWQKVQGREANRRRHRVTERTTKALCQPPPPPVKNMGVCHGGPMAIGGGGGGIGMALGGGGEQNLFTTLRKALMVASRGLNVHFQGHRVHLKGRGRCWTPIWPLLVG